MKIALGPLQYYWSRDTTMMFYAKVCDWPVAFVYLGETVCSRRHELRLSDWFDIAAMLAEAGKTPILSTQVLLESGKDMRTLRRITEAPAYAVEANDMGAVHKMQGQPFVAGPFLNLYNTPALRQMAALGANRWVVPLEMGEASLREILADKPPQLETEVFAYGRMPLAFSARCFAARHYNYPKDDCHYVCLQHPDGMLVQTKEGQPFLTINGIQTQSALVYTLIHELETLRDMGVAVIRLSPQAEHMETVVQTFHEVLTGKCSASQGHEIMRPLMPAAPCNGYWYGKPGLEMVQSQAA